jgi:hypothetical protein
MDILCDFKSPSWIPTLDEPSALVINWTEDNRP